MTLKEVRGVKGHGGGGGGRGAVANRVWISLTDQKRRCVKKGRQQDLRKEEGGRRRKGGGWDTFPNFLDFSPSYPGSPGTDARTEEREGAKSRWGRAAPGRRLIAR